MIAIGIAAELGNLAWSREVRAQERGACERLVEDARCRILRMGSFRDVIISSLNVHLGM